MSWRGLIAKHWPAALAVAVLVPHALAFDFVNDDAYISFRYARNLAEHGQLVFNLGERVEGFTNFLWTVLLAAGIKLGAPPEIASRVLGLLFGIATLVLVVRISRRLDGGLPSPWHAVAPVGLAATGAFACWTMGGLETQLFTFLTLLAFGRLLAEVAQGRGAWSGAVFALAAMTRPEGLLFFGLAGLFRLGANVASERRLVPRRHELAWAALFLALFTPYFAWRWRYYGWPFPNTFYVKSSGGAGTYLLGLTYLRRFVEDHGLLFLLPLAALGWPARADRARTRLFALVVLVWSAFGLYVVKVGGDFMGLYRFILPVLPLGAIAFQESLRAVARRLCPIAGRPAVALAGLGLAAGYLAVSARVSYVAATDAGAGCCPHGVDSPAYLKKYALDRIPVGKWLGEQARPGDLMSVGGAGVIPYYAKVPAFDCFGLVDETVAHDPAMTVGTRPGHQKWASDAYVLSRRPTLITHYYCLHGPCDQEQRIALPGYEWVRATIPGSPPTYYSFLKRIDRAFGPFPARAAP